MAQLIRESSGGEAPARRVVPCLALALVLAGSVCAETPDTPWPFFAFCMDTHDSVHRNLEEQAALLADLGYDGAGHLWLDNLEERIKTLDAAGLTLYQVYLRVNLNGAPPYDARLPEAVKLLHGRPTQLALLMDGFPPSDPAGDIPAVPILRTIANTAAEAGLTVVLYPHANMWIERVEDALRLIEKADQPNLGVMFNLCHWLKSGAQDDYAPLLKEAMPHLKAVSIHGADTATQIRAGQGNWIQPLDSGAFDMPALLESLRCLGYTGPIGLQCYGLPGDARHHLTRSIQAWRELRRGGEAP